MQNAWASLGPGADAFDAFSSRSDVFSSLMEADAACFADLGTGMCSFQGENFTALLDFISLFRSSASGDTAASDLRCRSGKQLLLRTKLYSFEDAEVAGLEFGGEISYKGLPSLSTSGSVLALLLSAPGNCLAMTSSCTRGAAAWEYLREFFTQEYQLGCGGFPANKEAFEKKLAKAMEFSWLYDKHGRQVYDRITGEKRIAALGTLYLSDYTAVNYYPITEERAQMLRDLVSAAVPAFPDEELLEVIYAAAKPFLSGSVSSGDAAAAVQAAAEEYFKR